MRQEDDFDPNVLYREVISHKSYINTIAVATEKQLLIDKNALKSAFLPY